MSVDVSIDNQFARVNVLQIFENHTGTDIEGKYIFVIPAEAQVSDFAIWDEGRRIPGVIMERQKARRIYEEITRRKIDPGLLERHEDPEEISALTCKVYPIPAYGTKRIELQFSQTLDITSLKSLFLLPLKPIRYRTQSAREFKATIEIENKFPIKDLTFHTKNVKFTTTIDDRFHKVYEMSAENLEFTEDLAFEYAVDTKDIFFSFLTYRNLEQEVLDVSPVSGERYKDDRGYFYSSLIFNLEDGEKKAAARKVAILLDVSLSMQWDKLERAFEAVEYAITNLGPSDKFQVILFNDEVMDYRGSLVPATRENKDAALTFIRESYLMGGTDLKGALTRAVETGAEYILMITDGHPTMNEIEYKDLKKHFDTINKGASLFVFGIGNDTNIPLLEELVKENDGYFTWVSDAEDIGFKIKTFFDKLGQDIIRGIKLLFQDLENLTDIYPKDPPAVFNKSWVQIVGRYREPLTESSVNLVGTYAGGEFQRPKKIEFPDRETNHAHIRRLWAKARVDHLLKRISYEGEKPEWINEIIALSKEFKFITPYTAFLAAPRSILRPRVIKPGDPILRVKTDSDIRSVIAIFPFGLTKSLRHISGEDVWETRFLAPKWMKDGEYKCLLVLEDKNGLQYREEKSFVIDSKPPTLYVYLNKEKLRAGESLNIKVYADSDTRRIRAKLHTLPVANIKYDAEAKASLGVIEIPEDVPSGVYNLKIVGEDFARNITIKELQIEVVKL